MSVQRRTSGRWSGCQWGDMDTAYDVDLITEQVRLMPLDGHPQPYRSRRTCPRTYCSSGGDGWLLLPCRFIFKALAGLFFGTIAGFAVCPEHTRLKKLQQQ